MLLNMKRMGIGFVEQRIDTVYDSEDYSSHYNAIKDSWRIFKVMFKFLLSSLGSTVIDLLIFYLVFRIFKDQLGTWASLVSTAARAPRLQTSTQTTGWSSTITEAIVARSCDTIACASRRCLSRPDS